MEIWKTNENEVRERMNELKTRTFFEKTWLRVCEGEMNSFFVWEWRKKEFKVRGKASTPSKISLKRKKEWPHEKQASKRNQHQQQREQGRLHRNGKGRARSIFLCEVEEEGYKEAKESTKKRNGGEMVISISWNSEKEERATGIMGVNQRNPPTFLRNRFISQRATKSEPRGSPVILGPALTF